MKLIKQSFEILEQKDFTLKGIKQSIERCARVSYKSENKMTDTSYEKFVNMLINNSHDRPLEFGTVHLKTTISNFHTLRDTLCINRMWNDQWIKYKYVGDITYITTNYRYYLAIKEVYSDIEKFFTEENNEYFPKRYTVHFIISRGIMDEFRTHVGLSHLAESTRYCNYSKDKFNNEVTFIIPDWCNSLVEGSKHKYSPFEINESEVEFVNALQNAQNSYLSLLKMGWVPQQTRSVLPLGIKSELISCGFENAWKSFFYRRCANDAHPMARGIAVPLQNKFKELGYINQ